MVEKNKPYDFPDEFRGFVLMPKFDTDLAELKSMVEPEDWEYKNTESDFSHPVLRNYIFYTYARIAEEKKIAVTSDEEYSCWNTGLITPSQQPVYMLLSRNKFTESKPYWHFWKFCKRGDRELNRFPTLPEMAHYFEDPSSLVYDTRKELRVNVDHMISDNKDRFPEEVRRMNDFAVQNLVKGAIDSAQERVKRNYKTAIPQYHKGSMQLLLPLCLLDPTKADLALAIERFTDFYRAATCLTLDMAYNNARQLARPDRDWLAP